MVLKTSPIPRGPAAKLPEGFGVLINGDPNTMSEAEWQELEELLYRHTLVLWRGVKLSPTQQFELTRRFDPKALSYGHGNNKTGSNVKSVLHPDLKTLPARPEVQLIGNGFVNDENIAPGFEKGVQLKHPHHKTFHAQPLSDEQDAHDLTRFYRWHIDAALYDLDPPIVTTLQAHSVPKGRTQICRYDDGTGDELEVPLGTTAFVSGTNMFDVLPANLKSLAVRSKVQYAPHPYTWMAPARAMSTGLGIESQGLELDKDKLPDWSESKIKTYPIMWKNPVTGKLHLQVHPCGAEKLHVAPIPAGVDRPADALYPDGGVVDDLKTVRELLYSLQRPGIAPEFVYAHDWEEHDVALFHNRGCLHSVVGAFKPEEVRAFWQCNMAATQPIVGPSEDDVKQFA